MQKIKIMNYTNQTWYLKDSQASMADVTMEYESVETWSKVAAVEKVEKYKHLQEQNQELKDVTNIVFMCFPLGTCGKCHCGNCEISKALGLYSLKEDCPCFGFQGTFYFCGHCVHVC